MLPVEVIKAKRDGRVLAPADLRALVDAYVAGEVPDYQMAAFCMAVFFRGMTALETSALTQAMLRSGEVLDLSDLPGVKVDKHSTGGVGDKVSLALAPIAAACGVVVPMISGRGLGHTGGTLDKLESIPGFQVRLPVERFREILASTGACLIGQTDRLAPADRRLYALRDVTATVESIPLIASSIMSKKLAEGIDALVLDVKVGSGAFMKRLEDAEALARALIGIGQGMGKRVVALLTGMDEPLGCAVGNALEIREAVDTIRGEGPADLTALVLTSAAHLLALSDLGVDEHEGRRRAEAAIASGAALSAYERWIRAQHGDPDLAALPGAPIVREVSAPRPGVVVSLGAIRVGTAALHLGAGRRTKADSIDHAVGVVCRKKRGDSVETGEVIAEIHARDETSAERAEAGVLAAYEVGDGDAPGATPIVLELVT